jgi:uncharacterized membrane protein
MTAVDTPVGDYLRRLEAASADLPPDRRSELLEGIQEHIASARAAGAAADEAAVRTLLDRLGEPAEIVGVAQEDLPREADRGGATGWDPPLVRRPRGTGLELGAVLMLTAGSLLPVVGWLVGVVLLWTSSLWRVREKLLGTLAVPLGPGGVLVLGALRPFSQGEVCTSTGLGEGRNVPPAAAPPPAAPAPPPFPADSPLPPPLVDDMVVCTSSGPPGWVPLAVAALMVVAPIVVAVLLYRTAQRRAVQAPELVSAAVPGYGPPGTTSPWGPLEIAAVALLGLGGVAFPVVPLLVGLLLACLSPRWTTSVKVVVGVLVVVPVTAFASFYALSAPFGLSAFGVYLLSPAVGLLAAALLAVQLGRETKVGR